MFTLTSTKYNQVIRPGSLTYGTEDERTTAKSSLRFLGCSSFSRTV